MPGYDLISMYATEEFVGWFARTFGAEVPPAFQRFLEKHPRGTNGACGRVYPPGDIVTSTEQGGLAAKGVCIIGRTAERGIFLLRVTDGKVFVVDEADYSAVSATFAGMDVCSRLLILDS
jgi:hypothetical protein